eukprot:CAMPEP_0113716870 /NCGR_PEP_ID=MMETSP0038_2-20120614/34163_1 /TAXON_ID=2898 /ORGANISM="Cryptomonas paramecium" /LENGTH=107 /DNA_ID=CAMNT_0000644507 /DNA_START=5 /DNA_END=324 /DNA_ORIENTATION=+ /assembly_acc=CAM_ASM_000170
MAMSGGNWLDGTMGGCTTLPGDSYYLFHGHSARLQVLGGPIGTVRTVASNELYMMGNIQGSPFNVTVKPAPTNFVTSVVTGSGLSLATAGMAATFGLSTRDSFANVR